jgi:hypothetical protein
MKRWTRRGAASVFACGVLTTGGVGAGARTAAAAPPTVPAAQGTFPEGTVVALTGTPHLWFADRAGVLHWGGDTRGLQGHGTNWDSRREVSLDQLKRFPRGDPWLSAGLLKWGDPIYFVKWETDQPTPTLLHIASITDVELFGITAANYGQFVLAADAWERKYGIPMDRLPTAKLAAVEAAPRPLDPARTYVNDKGFSIKLPPGWTSVYPMGAAVRAERPSTGPNEDLAENVSVWVDDVAPGTSVMTYFEQYRDTVLRRSSGALDRTTIDGLPAPIFTEVPLAVPGIRFTIETRTYIVVNGARAYRVVCNAYQGRLTNYRGTFEDAALSLRFE